MEQLLLIS